MKKIKSIAIIGEGETEWFYFESLRTTMRYPFKLTPGFPQHADIMHFIKLATDYEKKGYDHVICMIDMDRLLEKPAEMNKYKTERQRLETSGSIITFIETNPCTEYWFLLHFLPNIQPKHYSSYRQLETELRNYMPGYEKTRRYFRRTDLFSFLNEHGDINTAKQNAETLCNLSKHSPEDMISYSEVYKIFGILESM